VAENPEHCAYAQFMKRVYPHLTNIVVTEDHIAFWDKDDRKR
jgi:hypothetical protein